jgi:hypothetical protein
MPLEVTVRLLFEVSVAVIVCGPRVTNAPENVPVPEVNVDVGGNTAYRSELLNPIVPA